MCRVLRSVKGIVGGLLEMHENVRVGDIVERDLNDESRDCDIKVSHRADLLLVREMTSCDKRNALDLLNARADQGSHSKVLRVQYVRCSTFESMTLDKSKVMRWIKQSSKTAKKWTHVDVDAAARSGGFTRVER